jgi:hypothetical protein
MKLSLIPPPPVASLNIPVDEPCYKIGEEGFFGPDDTFHEEGDYIVFDGIPAMNFIPMNELAEEKILAYFTELDVLGAEAAKLAKRGYISLVSRLEKDEEDEPVENKGIRSLTKAPAPSTLGKKKRGRPPVKKIGSDNEPKAPDTQLGKTVELDG